VPVHRREVYDSIHRNELTDHPVGDQPVAGPADGEVNGAAD